MDVDVLVAGVPHSLTDDVVCNLLEQAGIGLPPLHRLSERGPQQHGDSDQGFRLDPRVISLLLRLEPPNIIDKRDALLTYFTPRDDALTLRWTRDDAEVRSLDCHYIARLTLATKSSSRFLMKVPAQFKSSDNPSFYDPVGVHVVFAIAGGGDAWAVPMAIPWPIGSSAIDSMQPVAYVGTWRTYPVITVSGPLNSCIITNLDTDEKLDFTGLNLPVAEQRVIDLRYARKTVVDELGADALPDLTTDSDLTTWHLAAAPDAPGGVNDVRVTGTAATANTDVRIEYLNRYISL